MKVRSNQPPPLLGDVKLTDEAVMVLMLLRDGWVMFVEARLPYAYLMKAGKKLRRTLMATATELIGAGEIVPKGPDAFVARPLENLL